MAMEGKDLKDKMSTLRIWFIFQKINVQTCQTFTIISKVFLIINFIFPKQCQEETKKGELSQIKSGRERRGE